MEKVAKRNRTHHLLRRPCGPGGLWKGYSHALADNCHRLEEVLVRLAGRVVEEDQEEDQEGAGGSHREALVLTLEAAREVVVLEVAVLVELVARIPCNPEERTVESLVDAGRWNPGMVHNLGLRIQV